MRRRGDCSLVVEVHGVRLADDGADKRGEGDSDGGERELHNR